jgi:hypothetical protein
MMRNRRRLISTLSVAAVLAVPGADAAFAQNGVTVDPGSPTGKEYAIPLEQARRDASAEDGGELNEATHGERTAPLFGEGVGDDTSSAQNGASNRDDPASSDGGGRKGGKPQATSADGRSGTTVGSAIGGTRALQATVPEGGTSSALTIGALAVSVLLLGAVLGSIARRRSN